MFFHSPLPRTPVLRRSTLSGHVEIGTALRQQLAEVFTPPSNNVYQVAVVQRESSTDDGGGAPSEAETVPLLEQQQQQQLLLMTDQDQLNNNIQPTAQQQHYQHHPQQQQQPHFVAPSILVSSSSMEKSASAQDLAGTAAILRRHRSGSKVFPQQHTGSSVRAIVLRRPTITIQEDGRILIEQQQPIEAAHQARIIVP
ncbi:hypothetical protein GPALN_013251 [Globodera pallida]|nr:hypothetical protein GPALN_013251 [Globodera pallida]